MADGEEEGARGGGGAATDGLSQPFIAPGRFPHPGSWSACGGNARGTSDCLGNGNCGPLCSDCGAGTHWTCCGCPYASSAFCLPSLSHPQAVSNNIIFRSPRSPSCPTFCTSIPGISLPPALPHPTDNPADLNHLIHILCPPPHAPPPSSGGAAASKQPQGPGCKTSFAISEAEHVLRMRLHPSFKDDEDWQRKSNFVFELLERVRSSSFFFTHAHVHLVVHVLA